MRVDKISEVYRQGVTQRLLDKYKPSKKFKIIDGKSLQNNETKAAWISMYNKKNSRNGFIHLYNPLAEGLGGYDIHYINAYKKNKFIQKTNEAIEWDAAWLQS